MIKTWALFETTRLAKNQNSLCESQKEIKKDLLRALQNLKKMETKIEAKEKKKKAGKAIEVTPMMKVPTRIDNPWNCDR